MLGLAELQKSPQGQRLLRAFSDRYDVAKRLFALQGILAVPVSIGLGIISTFHHRAAALGGAYTVLFSVFDVLVLDRVISTAKRTAARVQDLFDGYVLGIQWNEEAFGLQPDEEDIADWSRRLVVQNRPNSDRIAALAEWYPPSLDDMPPSARAVSAQRLSLRWDAELSRRYAVTIAAASIGLPVVVLLFGLAKGQDLAAFIGMLVTLLPAVTWGCKELVRQNDARSAASALKERAERLWRQALRHQVSDQDLGIATRDIQDALCEHRATHPLVFNWFYRLWRSDDELSMTRKARAMVDEWRSANSGQRDE